MGRTMNRKNNVHPNQDNNNINNINNSSRAMACRREQYWAMQQWDSTRSGAPIDESRFHIFYVFCFSLSLFISCGFACLSISITPEGQSPGGKAATKGNFMRIGFTSILSVRSFNITYRPSLCVSACCFVSSCSCTCSVFPFGFNKTAMLLSLSLSVTLRARTSEREETHW